MDTMNDELWRVQLSTGEIRMMTLDALDRAFDEGLIDARVPVLPPGASAWTTLGEAAGLDDCPTEQSPSLSPLAISSAAASPTASPTEESNADRDLDLPDSFDELRPRRSRALVIGGVASALALAATVAVLAGKLGSSMPAAADVKAAAAVEAPPPAAVETLPPPAPKEEPKQGLSDWQKRMLLDADKARDDKARPKSQERAEKAGQQQKKKPQPPTTSSGLLNGGDKFDPLNGAL